MNALLRQALTPNIFLKGIFALKGSESRENVVFLFPFQGLNHELQQERTPYSSQGPLQQCQ